MFAMEGAGAQGMLDDLAVELRAVEAAMAAWLSKLAAYDRSQEWRADGYVTCAGAIRDVCNLNAGVARGYVDLARKLERMPVLAGAFGAGVVSRQHAQVIAHAYTPERADALAGLESELVDAAAKFTPRELAGLVRYATDAIDGDGGASADARAFAGRRFSIAETIDGMVVENGLCDPETGQVHMAAIRAELERDHAEGDTRTYAQRCCDALTNILRRSLDNGELGESHGVRPHLTVVTDVSRLPGVSAELIDLARTEREIDGRLSRATIERLLCGCDISRVLVNGPSEVLDVGRAQRTVSAAQWKALVVRDRHCIFPGCRRPPASCEAHHIEYWEHGGTTDLANLALLCRHHHRQLHEETNRDPTTREEWADRLHELIRRRRRDVDPPPLTLARE